MFGSVTSKVEKPKSTVNRQQPLTEYDNKATAHKYESVTTKENISKSTKNVRQFVTYTDKEDTTDRFGSVRAKDETPKRVVNRQQPLEKNDREANAHEYESMTTKEKNPKSRKNVRQFVTYTDKEETTDRFGSVTAKDEKPKRVVNRQQPFEKNDKEANAHEYESMTTKEKNSKSTKNVRQFVTYTDKEETTDRFGSVTEKDKKLKCIAFGRRPLPENDKETITHKYEPVTEKEKKSKSTINVRRFVMDIDKTETGDRFVSVASEIDKPKSTVNVRRPLTEKSKSSVNVRQVVTEIDNEETAHKFESVTATVEKPKSIANVRRPLTEHYKEATTHKYESETAKEEKRKTILNVRRLATELEKEGTADMSGSMTEKVEKPKSTVHVWRTLTENDKETTAHKYESVAATMKKSKSRMNVQRLITEIDKEERADRFGSVTEKVEIPKSTVNVRRLATENDEETTGHKYESVTLKKPESTVKVQQLLMTINKEETADIFKSVISKVEKPKSTVNVRRPATEKDKETTTHKYESVTSKDRKPESTVNVQRSVTKIDKEETADIFRSVISKVEKPKSTVNVRRPATKNDKETTAHKYESLTSKEKKHESTVNVQRLVTKIDKEETEDMFGSVTSKIEKPRSTVNRQQPLTENDKEVKVHKYESVIATERKSKSTVNVRQLVTEIDKEEKADIFGSLTSKVEKPKSTVNVRRPATENDEETTAHKYESVTSKEKKPESTVKVQRLVTKIDKEETADMFGSVTSKVVIPKSTVNVRRPATENDEETTANKHESVPYVWRPLTESGKEACAHQNVTLMTKEKKTESTVNNLRLSKYDQRVTPHMFLSMKAKDEKPKSTKNFRQPLTEIQQLTTEDTEAKPLAYNGQLLKVKDITAKSSMNIQKPSTENDNSVISSVYTNEQITAKDIRSSLSLKPDENRTNEIIRGPWVANDEKAHVRGHDQESKSTAHIQRPFTRRDDEIDNGTNIQRPLTAKDKQAENTIRSRKPLTAQDKSTTHSRDQWCSKTVAKSIDGILGLSSAKDQEDESTAYICQSENVSKNEAVDGQSALRTRVIQAGLETSLSDTGGTVTTTIIRPTLTSSDVKSYERMKMQRSLSAEVSEKHISFREDEKVSKQSVFTGRFTEAQSLDKTSMTEEKYKIFETQMGISCNVQKEKPRVVPYTDERKMGEIAVKQRLKESVSDIQNKPIFRKSRGYVKSQLCGTKYQEGASVNPKGTRISFMFNLKEDDPCEIVYELTKSPLLLSDCIDCISKDEHNMFVFLQILAKAFSSKSTSQLMIMLFETLKEKGFFDILAEYFTRTIIQIKTGQANTGSCNQTLKNTLNILVEQMTRNPSSVVAFRKLHALMGLVIDELAENGTVDDKVTAKFELFTEQKKLTEKERRQSSQPIHYSKPPDDFRDYSVPPTADEITGRVKPFLRQNAIQGGYEDLNDYLDVQFRLLREDFVGPLREGMTGYIDLMTSKKGYKNTSECVKNLDIKIYENVRVHSPVVTQHGLCYKLKLQMTPTLKRTQWKFSKRLIFGSMVCLTDKDFEDFFLATVVEREEKDIKRGYFIVHFEREDVSSKDLLNKVFRMAETSGYFEAYRHVLVSLQTFKDGDLPFEKYIVKCEKKMLYPAYLTPSVTYDLRPLVDQSVKIKAVRRFSISGLASLFSEQPTVEFSRRSHAARDVLLTDCKNWPSKELLKMDDSQYRAVQTALTSEFAIIQGPPGTGKTYIGLQIVKALLHNKSAWAGFGRCHKPMLIVCYTNHALDQFLEGIVKYFEGDVLRVGGRSNSTELEKYNLKMYRQIRFKKGSTLARLQFEKRQARRHMEAQSGCVQRLAKTIQIYQSEIVTEDILSEMDERLYENLVSGYKGKIKTNLSYINTWLEIEVLENECKKEVQNRSKAKKCKHVQVNDEVTHVLKERMLDIEEDIHLSENESSNLQKTRKTDIAGSVKDTDKTYREKGKEVDREETETEKFQKLFKYTIASRITDEDVMSQAEADSIKDIWKLSHKSRWRLYRLWIQNICAKLYEKIETRKEYFEAAAKAFQNALMQVDKEIMKDVAIIGMTTSGAARYQSVLRDIGPRIIVVEEAAEVLEAHIITTLSKGCEHLILIGDHKQLRPNPTVYKLAVKYNLDISLFERMVKNGMQFNCLELQHRMRPEISSIMRHIYPDLKDHDHVKTYPNVKGIATNLFLINHAHLESSDGDIKSYSNPKEAEYAVALCRYLLLQGYERQDVTVLTTYTGQLMCLRNIMPKKEFDGVNVTVVDNYQGEENKIIILSLVRSNTINKIGFLKIENRICVALSRAKIGFFVLGNFDHLANHSALWKEIVTDMKSKKCFGKGLVLYCQNHPNDNAIIAEDHEDFKRAPEGGCMKKCNVRLECGHKCERYCHVLDKEHETNKCQKPCTKILCEYGHKCPDKCYIECSPCRVMRIKTIPICGHTQLVPCAMEPEEFCCRESCTKRLQCGHMCKECCGEPHTSKCLEEITFTWSCGHSSQIMCWEAKSKLCPRPCETKLKCNHICSGTCGTCFKGRFHQPCRERCVTPYLWS